MPFESIPVGGGVGFGPTVSVSWGKPALPPPPPVVFALGLSSTTVAGLGLAVPLPSPPSVILLLPEDANFLFTVSVSGGEPALPPPPPVVFGVVVCVDEVGLGAVGENLLLSTGAILMMPLTIDGCKGTKRRLSPPPPPQLPPLPPLLSASSQMGVGQASTFE